MKKHADGSDNCHRCTCLAAAGPQGGLTEMVEQIRWIYFENLNTTCWSFDAGSGLKLITQYDSILVLLLKISSICC